MVNVTQCAGGSVQMNQYHTGKLLEELGVISGKDMTTEAAIIKLMFLLGQGLSNPKIKEALQKNISGEITI